MKKKWWHDKVAYQIYPKSFNDTNGDGIGDLNGVIEKLDYLKELGIDIIWLSPIYQSPFVDQGYDISDYYKIAEEFGTMEEFDILLAESKKRGMGIVMDLVINHCSDQHEWFQKALAEPDGEYADCFYFREGKNGNPPSNYRSYFGGSAWEKVPGTDKYYLHMFAKEQPDLNWENKKVVEELYKMIRWWLEKGIAGFRVDAIINIKKDTAFPDFEVDGPDGLCHCTKMVDAVDGVGEMLRELKEETFAKYDAFTVGEVFNMKEEELESFVGDDGYFSSMFDFAPHILIEGENGWYDAKSFCFADWKRAIIKSQIKCQEIGLLANVIENHDEPRGACRYLPEYAQNTHGIQMLGTVNVLLRGMPFIYQGQEIGMRNCKMNSIHEYDDIDTYHQYELALEAGLNEEQALDVCFHHSRDNARTPMQWSGDVNAGFSKVAPWLRVNDNYKDINVQAQEKDKDSVLNFYRRLVKLRKNPEWIETFTYGDFLPLFEEHDSILGFYRQYNEKKILILANFGKEPVTLELESESRNVLLSNMNRDVAGTKTLTLESCEVLVSEE